MSDDEEAEGVQHLKTLKKNSFECVMSDDEEAEGVKHVKKLKQKSFEYIMSDYEETQEVEQVKEGDFWSTQITLMEMCQSFEELVPHLQNTEFPDFIPEFYTVMCLSDIVDKISQKLYPHDAPQDLLPRFICGDGNCLCRTLSVITFGTEHRHKEV